MADTEKQDFTVEEELSLLVLRMASPDWDRLGQMYDWLRGHGETKFSTHLVYTFGGDEVRMRQLIREWEAARMLHKVKDSEDFWECEYEFSLSGQVIAQMSSKARSTVAKLLKEPEEKS